MGQASQPAIMTDYEFVLARSAIDFGADVVLCHHHHFLRGIELYRQQADLLRPRAFCVRPAGPWESLTDFELVKLKQRGEYAIYPRPGYPLSPFHEDPRMTMIALCEFRDAGSSRRIGFVPCLINADNQAVPLRSASADFHRIKAYVKQIGETTGLRTRYQDGQTRGIDCVLVEQ